MGAEQWHTASSDSKKHMRGRAASVTMAAMHTASNARKKRMREPPQEFDQEFDQCNDTQHTRGPHQEFDHSSMHTARNATLHVPGV
eukprot:272699-Rhodomonas_salina.2